MDYCKKTHKNQQLSTHKVTAKLVSIKILNTFDFNYFFTPPQSYNKVNIFSIFLCLSNEY